MNLQALLSRVLRFLRDDIWRIRLQSASVRRRLLLRPIRIVLLACRGFHEDQGPLHAASLTFYTLLSIVPVLAMAFGIAKGFGFTRLLHDQILVNFSGQEEVINRIVAYANTLLENAKGGVVAGIGVIILFYSVIKVLSHIEGSFNAIWKIATPRGLGRRFSDYLSIMLIGPVLVILSGSATVYATTQVSQIAERFALIGLFSPFIFMLLKLIPYTLIWILFTFVYLLMPNTRVNFVSGLLAGFMAGTLYQLAQWAYIAFQVGAARYNAIYGSFAALPLFLVWLQLSWMIVLLGAEVAYAHQHADSYEFEPDTQSVSTAFKKLVALQVTHFIAKQFSRGARPPTAPQVSEHLEMPIRLTQRVLRELVQSGILRESTIDANGEGVYQPARDTHQFTLSYVLDALEHQGIDTIPIPRTPAQEELQTALDAFREAVERSPANRLLIDI